MSMKLRNRTTMIVLAGGVGLVAAIAIYAVTGGFGHRGDAAAKDAAGHHHAGEHAGDHAGAASATAATAAPDARVRIETTPAPGPAPEGMVWVPGGTYWMGCDDCGMSDTGPVHLVKVDGFWMDRTPVTNAQFAAFVKATGYVTVAEKAPDPKDFPNAPREALVAGSAVFVAPASASLDNPMSWWRYVPGASWRQPEGKGSSIEGRENHPVVHVAWDDAAAYLKWAKKELPTEAQYEFAARGGLDRQRYAWGNELRPAGGRTPANIWQGRFPVADTREDGYSGTSPVSAFAPNGFGLFDMGGNVWQWCADWYRPDAYALATTGSGSAIDASSASAAAISNPRGPSDSYDPDEPSIPKRVQRGGSFLCSDQYCSRYLVGSRGKGAQDSGGSNVGFRGVRVVSAM
jgi:sulfatase modifying factor 1